MISRIIDAVKIKGRLHRKFTLATPTPLVKDTDEELPDQEFNYSSVVGMLQYLQGHSRPDLTYSVSQVSCYAHFSRKLHEIAIERIAQYLLCTQDKGLILRPLKDEDRNIQFDLDCFVDTDFAGLWPHKDKQDPTCVKSRTG